MDLKSPWKQTVFLSAYLTCISTAIVPSVLQCNESPGKPSRPFRHSNPVKPESWEQFSSLFRNLFTCEGESMQGGSPVMPLRASLQVHEDRASK